MAGKHDSTAPHRCSKCDTVMVERTITRDLPVGDAWFTVTTPAWECPVEGNFVLGARAWKALCAEGERLMAMHGPATGGNLRMLRLTMGLGLEELARLTGIDGVEIDRIERARKTVPPPLLWATVSALFLDRIDSPMPMRSLLEAANATEVERRTLDLRDVAA